MLKKTTFMRNAVIVLLSAFFLSCENPTDIGFPDGSGGNQAFFTDSLDIQIENLQLDSLLASGQSSALVGSYDDPAFGKVTAAAFLQPTLPQGSNSFTGALETVSYQYTSGLNYDSVAIRLANKSLLFFGDSLSTIRVNVHRLNSRLEDNNYNYNSRVAYDPTPIASVDINREAMVNDTGLAVYYNLILPDEIGQELIDLSNGEIIDDRDTFEDAFPGFVLIAEAGAEAITIFNLGSQANSSSTNSSLVLFYHDTGSEEKKGFTFDFTAGRFNQLEFDRSGTALEGVNSSGQSKSYEDSGNRVFVQAAAGIGGKVRFPALSELGAKEVGYAELEYAADTTTFSGQIDIAPFITALTLDANGTGIRTNGFYSYINTTLDATSGVLTTYDDSLNVFKTNITPYLQAVQSGTIQDNGIFLASAIPASSGGGSLIFGSALNRVVLKDFKLNLYYTK
ncbi:DUF4270 family protein [Jiulongibacter sp. NS-SX5]|uniref:DUF4270 family protein n=1 Tax=Jiulongibacter sp. NS-SX5 TaxID=3463854 RepID=UPI00405A2364